MTTTSGMNLTVSAGVFGDVTGAAGSALQDAHLAVEQGIAFSFGTGANQAEKVYSEAINIAASSSETDDLQTLTDVLGNSLSFSAIKAVIVFAASSNVNNIVVGDAASDPWSAPFDTTTDTVSVPPGGMLVLANPSAAGWAVSGSTLNLKLANSSSGTAVTGQLVIIGI